LITREMGQSARLGHAYALEDTRHLPIREWPCLAVDFTARRILSCVLQEQKAPILRGYWRIVGWNL
jgi:hypothetical protein